MTHSGGKPHAVGDKGQRYEVHAVGYPKPGDNVIGWTDSESGAFRMMTAIAKAPGCTGSSIIDRKPPIEQLYHEN